MEVRLFMSGEVIFKVGSISTNTYIVLEGAAALVSPCEDEELLHDQIFIQSLNQDAEVVGIMREGCHFGNDLPEGTFNYNGRRICHMVALQPVLVGVITKDKLDVLYKCFPKWKKKIQEINQFTFSKCEEFFEIYKSEIQDYILGYKPREFFRNQNLSIQELGLQFIEHHITYTQEESYMWMARRLKLYLKERHRVKEDLITKQKVFYYG